MTGSSWTLYNINIQTQLWPSWEQVSLCSPRIHHYYEQQRDAGALRSLIPSCTVAHTKVFDYSVSALSPPPHPNLSYQVWCGISILFWLVVKDVLNLELVGVPVAKDPQNATAYSNMDDILLEGADQQVLDDESSIENLWVTRDFVTINLSWSLYSALKSAHKTNFCSEKIMETSENVLV